MNGYVYFLAECDRENPRIKIGKTQYLDKRMNQIQPALPTKTILLHHIETNNIDVCENVFHSVFSEKRCNGEWFDLGADDMHRISNVVSFDNGKSAKEAWLFQRICKLCKSYFHQWTAPNRLEEVIICPECELIERSKLENQTWMNYGE